jgi:hypothetical protein
MALSVTILRVQLIGQIVCTLWNAEEEEVSLYTAQEIM